MTGALLAFSALAVSVRLLAGSLSVMEILTLRAGIGLAVMATLAALMVASQGGPLHLAVALHFAPLPYNLFLFVALWRTPRRTAAAAGVGLAWVAAMTFA